MRVLLLGGNGYLGPHIVKALEGAYELRITDVVPIDSHHDTVTTDISDYKQVRAAAEGSDVIVNCSVSRRHRRLAFDVNTRGTWNALKAAVELEHKRFVNTGPRFTIVGSRYLSYDYGIVEGIPPHPGTGLYPITKSLGHEIGRLFTKQFSIHVLSLMFSRFCEPEPASGSEVGMNAFAVTFRDAAAAVRKALEVDLSQLPSRCESFFITADLPQDQVRTGKARLLLGWEPQDSLERYWRQR